MDHNGILTAYHQGPEAVINLFVETYTKQELRIHELETRNKQLEETIQRLEARIQELEASRKKTPQTAINHLQPMGFKSLSRKAYEEKQVVQQVDSLDIKVIHFEPLNSLILSSFIGFLRVPVARLHLKKSRSWLEENVKSLIFQRRKSK